MNSSHHRIFMIITYPLRWNTINFYHPPLIPPSWLFLKGPKVQFGKKRNCIKNQKKNNQQKSSSNHLVRKKGYDWTNQPWMMKNINPFSWKISVKTSSTPPLIFVPTANTTTTATTTQLFYDIKYPPTYYILFGSEL